MNLDLKGRRALVGGATSGLGLATAHALAQEGCTLILWSSNAGRLTRTADSITAETGATVETVAADNREHGAAEHIAKSALATGPVDIVVLNGGGPPPVNPAETTSAGWAAALQAQAVMPILLATALLPAMRARGFGRILAILSSGVAEPIQNLAYSNVGRSALAAWLKTTAAEVGRDGITVNGVMPGRFDTPRVASLDEARAANSRSTAAQVREASEALIPLGRYGRPDEFAKFVTFLSSPLASYITGRMHAVDGGLIRST